MKKIIILLFLSLWLLSIQGKAQQCTFSGKVIDGVSNEPLFYSTVRLFQLPDSTLFMGVIANNDGTFLLQNIEYGSFLCNITSFGYQQEIFPVNFSKEKKHIDLGSIKLTPIINLLQGVGVSSQKVPTKLGKTVYNIDSALLTGTTTTLDLMKKLPELSVNQVEDAIDIKGVLGNTMVMLNGVSNPSQLKLKSIDPQSIKKIEIITEPSSEHDADVGGIVNIILKDEIHQGYSITFDANYLTPINRAEAFFSFNYNWKKVRYSVNYCYNFWGGKIKDTMYRETQDELQSYTYQSITKQEKNREQGHRIENRLDYYINEYNFLSFTFSNNFNPRIASYNFLSMNSINDSLLSSTTASTRNQDNYSIGNYTVFYRKNLKKNEDQKLTVNFNFHHQKAKNISEYIVSQVIDSIIIAEHSRNEVNNTTRYSYNLKIDYEHPVSDKFRFNTGALGYSQIFNNTFKDDKNTDTTYQYVTLKTHLYFDLLFNIGKFNFRIGNKVESYLAYIESQHIFNNTEYLPSLSISRNFSGYHTLSLNFRTGCFYPSVWALTPYTTYSADSTSSSAGNVKLKPQTRYTANLTYIFRKGGSMLRTMASYSYVKNMFTQQITFLEGNTIVRQLVNMPGKTTWALTVIYGYDSDLFSVGCTVIPFFEYFNNTRGYRKNISCDFSVYNYWYLPLDFEIDVDFSYGAKTLTPNGYFKAKPQLNIYLFKSFLKGDIRLAFGYTGLIFSNENFRVTEQDNFYEWNKTISSYKGFYLRFTYFLHGGKAYEKEYLESFKDSAKKE